MICVLHTPMKHDYKKLFKNLRMDLKISQAKFARLVGANRDIIANYESGRSKPSADILMNALGLIKKQKNHVRE